jgi:hypothetical protein
VYAWDGDTTGAEDLDDGSCRPEPRRGHQGAARPFRRAGGRRLCDLRPSTPPSARSPMRDSLLDDALAACAVTRLRPSPATTTAATMSTSAAAWHRHARRAGETVDAAHRRVTGSNDGTYRLTAAPGADIPPEGGRRPCSTGATSSSVPSRDGVPRAPWSGSRRRRRTSTDALRRPLRRSDLQVAIGDLYSLFVPVGDALANEAFDLTRRLVTRHSRESAGGRDTRPRCGSPSRTSTGWSAMPSRSRWSLFVPPKSWPLRRRSAAVTPSCARRSAPRANYCLDARSGPDDPDGPAREISAGVPRRATARCRRRHGRRRAVRDRPGRLLARARPTPSARAATAGSGERCGALRTFTAPEAGTWRIADERTSMGGDSVISVRSACNRDAGADRRPRLRRRHGAGNLASQRRRRTSTPGRLVYVAVYGYGFPSGTPRHLHPHISACAPERGAATLLGRLSAAA